MAYEKYLDRESECSKYDVFEKFGESVANG